MRFSIEYGIIEPEVNRMEVVKVTPRGYCKGVVRAIQIAKECAMKYPDVPITVLGMLVHNRYVMEALKLYHIQMIDDPNKTRVELLDDISEGIVIFTAHGIAPSVFAKAKEKGLIIIDATCPDVLKTQEIVQAHLSKGYEILYIGKAHHPEAEAVCAISNHIHLIESSDHIPLHIQNPVFVTNQTTMSIFDLKRLFDQIKVLYPDAVFCEEICNATRIRQEAVANAANEGVDVLFVVGDITSNNSNRLAQIALEQGIKRAYLIDSVQDIQDEQLLNCQRVAVTAGASTPTYLTNQVISYLNNYATQKQKPEIVISKIL